MMRTATSSTIATLLFAGCVTHAPPVQPVTRSFVFTPPEQARAHLPATIALVRPAYAEATRARTKNVGWARSTTDAFASSLRSDLERMLVAKGFKVAGPYDTLEMMTFPEKRAANLTLTPVVELTLDSRITRRATPTTYIPSTEEGMLTVGGWVSLVMLEPMSGEKMWIKRVDVEAVHEPYATAYTVQVTRDGQRIQNIHRDTRPDAFTRALNMIYPKVMDRAWTYFHPDEVMLTKKQAEEVRERKRY